MLGATLGPVNETNMARIWNKHKQFHPVRNNRFSNGAGTSLKRKVFVAMSGGVDSSVAAFLLKRVGYDVHGVYMKEWVPAGITCEAGSDRDMAARVAAHLNIPFEVWDFRKEYKKHVADYMLREYKAGRTPNPDVMCNREVKFGVFLKQALKQGADFIATGHYVIKHEAWNMKHRKLYKNVSSFRIHASRDTNKDQSYFLWTLTQQQLKYCLFPIGGYAKSEVRVIAKKAGLPSWDKKDSQGVCFVGKLDFGQFLRKYLPHKKGKIVTTDGKEIGTHDGVWFYTLGQRHGIGIGGGTPYYVAAKNLKKNILIVGVGDADKKLFQKELTAQNLNWVSGNPLAGGSTLPMVCKARIRYRQPLETCRVSKTAQGVKVVFSKPQRAITPGQSIVFYKSTGNLPAGRQVLGGGIIDTVK